MRCLWIRRVFVNRTQPRKQMRFLELLIVVPIIALGYVNSWVERTFDARTQFLVTIVGSVLLVMLIVGFTTYSWIWIMMGSLIMYSIYRRYKAFLKSSATS